MCGCTGKPKSAATPSRAIILRKPAVVNGAPRSRRKDERRRRVLLALEPAQRPQLAAGQRVDRLRAALEPADMQAAMGKIDGVPPQRDQLARPQAVPVGDQHHGGVAVAMAVLAGCRDQPSDLAVGQVLARADLGVAPPLGGPASSTVPITVVGATSARCDFSMVFQAFHCDCPLNRRLWDTAQGEKRRLYGHNCDLGRCGRTGQHARDAELAGIFCRRAQPTPTASNDQQRRGKTEEIRLQCTTRGVCEDVDQPASPRRIII